MVISGEEGQDLPSAPGKPELGLNCLNSSSGCGTGGNRAWVFSFALGMNVESILGAVYGGGILYCLRAAGAPRVGIGWRFSAASLPSLAGSVSLGSLSGAVSLDSYSGVCQSPFLDNRYVGGWGS